MPGCNDNDMMWPDGIEDPGLFSTSNMNFTEPPLSFEQLSKELEEVEKMARTYGAPITTGIQRGLLNVFGDGMGVGVGGIKIVEYNEPLKAKIQLSEDIDLSPEFRFKMNEWLIDRFGYKEPVLRQNEAIMIPSMGMAIMPPAMVSAINAFLGD